MKSFYLYIRTKKVFIVVVKCMFLLPTRKENSFVRTSPVGSSNSSLTVSIKADTVSSETTNAEINTVRQFSLFEIFSPPSSLTASCFWSLQAPEVKSSTVNPELDVDRLFKKSIKRGTKPAGLYCLLTCAVLFPVITTKMWCFFFLYSLYVFNCWCVHQSMHQHWTCVMNVTHQRHHWAKGADLYQAWIYRRVCSCLDFIMSH